MICLAYVTGPAQMPSSPEVAKAPGTIEYQPLPETAIGGGAKPADAKPAAPAAAPAQASNAGPSFDKVHSVIQERCSVCHSAKPTSPLFSAAPAGVMFDTPDQIRQNAARIQAQAVTSQIMPLGNITQMTQQERDLIGAWIVQGAQTN
jgi:uncharacterized membrane protein